MVGPISSSGGFIPSQPPIAGGMGGSVPSFSPTEEAPKETTSGNALVSARYTSPILVVDQSTKIVVYQHRDPISGKVLNQYPTEQAIQEYKKAEQRNSKPAGDAPVDNPSLAFNTSAPFPVATKALDAPSKDTRPQTGSELPKTSA